MKHHFADIRKRIKSPPTWWDENGTPRWGKFTPHATANIYAREACLMAIECQNCGHGFKVCMSFSHPQHKNHKPLSDSIKDLHYGDPPNIECCPGGPTMNSIPRRVLQFWKSDQTTGYEWKRCPELELDIECPWADDEDEPAALCVPQAISDETKE